MFKLNFKIALRNIWKNKTSSLINISGLAIGLAACLMLLLYVSYEWNFDKQSKDDANTYQVMMNHRGVDGQITETGQSTSNVIAPLFKQKYSWVKTSARLSWAAPYLVSANHIGFKKTGAFADPGILDIFNYTFIYGDERTALNAPNSVIITESTARLFFGTTDVLNKSIRFQNALDLKITGVIRDLPANMSRSFDYLMPWSFYESRFDWAKKPNWQNYSFTTLLKIDPQTNVDQINSSIKDLYLQNGLKLKVEPYLFRYSKLHLYGNFVNGISTGGSITQLRLFMGLAIGILLIACINFMNMATAKSEKRAKEVGIKKTIGATRSSLISQFLMESLVLTLLAAVFAVVLIEMCLPFFNHLLGIELGINYSGASIWLGLLAVVLVTGLIAGSYPAFYLSSFNPVQIFRKRSQSKGILSVSLRQVLVVGQFSFAVILIIATTVIYQQIQFIKNRPVGYQINNLVEMEQDGELYAKFELLRSKLLESGAVSSVLQSSTTITRELSSIARCAWPGSSEDDKLRNFNTIATTYGFVKTTGIKLLYGRDFSPKFASDTNGILISHSAMKVMNMKNPIGQVVFHDGDKAVIVGVFEDFILGSPFSTEKPLIIHFNKEWSGIVTMRLNPGHPAAENIAAIEKIVKQINPAYPVNVTFVDELYAKKLTEQRRLGILSNLFGGLAIFISCLGLFGLASYSAEQRTKEIGVRKVLGASVSSLMRLLSFSFLKMVGIAIIISIPVANYIMSNWLKSFEFHTSVNWVVILLAAAGTIGIALFTVSFQAYKAAKANPVEALKYE
ncbi:FtsX-like permease family protein [Pedobacter westerhofensis]|uniref:FtsX-like permease family protein n=1 Tax=Pedobacter westerhofensis TaxID=425512 RepID=A0A521E7D0_9SPHI|nr:ABC transporter permease [Pedobacter westerhofensis]SMO79772.1 FtsX-like permease family protein [Pedobacter westerhofensis]